MTYVDLSLALRGKSIPIDYGYPLFGAISRLIPQIHGDRRIGIHPIRGIQREPRKLALVPQSRLRIRMPDDQIATYLMLVGNGIDLDGSMLLIGFPRTIRTPDNKRIAIEAVRVEPLRPAAELSARLVTLGQIQNPGEFEASLRRQIAGLGIAAEPRFMPSTDPKARGGPERRVIRIKGRKIVGFPVRLSGLTAEESLTVQAVGLGSRRRMGCGVFVPVPTSGRRVAIDQPTDSEA